jgi:hypothetical protein
MTIVMSVALTLAGEQAIKSVASYITSIKSAVSAAGELSDVQNGKKEEQPKGNKTALAPFGSGGFSFWKPTFTDKEVRRPYQISDELALVKDKKQPAPEIELPGVIPVNPTSTDAIVKTALATEMPAALPAAVPTLGDPYAVFLTPSTLPFDVYSTTLALGNNYGFGEYYGIGSGNYTIVPEATTVSVLALRAFSNTRKREA